MSSRTVWTDEYYEALRFYYWEPQWLNRHAGATVGDNKSEQVLAKLRLAEVPLNHIMNIFFSLAPAALISRFMAQAIPGWISEPMIMRSAPKLLMSPKIDLCQTDIFFEGSLSRIALELKIGAKTSANQVMKYALFLNYYGEQNLPSTSKQPYLLYMSPHSGSYLPKGKFIADFREAMAFADLGSTVSQFARENRISRTDVIALAAALPIAETTYKEFGIFLHSEEAQIGQTEGDETLRHLIHGLLVEMSLRGLQT